MCFFNISLLYISVLIGSLLTNHQKKCYYIPQLERKQLYMTNYEERLKAYKELLYENYDLVHN